MDNFQLDITSENEINLKSALQILFTRNRTVTGFSVSKEFGLILYRDKSPEATPLPYAYGVDDTVKLISGWLKEQDYGPEPGHDGSNGKGWRIHNGQHGRIGDDYRAFIAVQPCWAWYGK